MAKPIDSLHESLRELFSSALEARKKAYAPYSKFKVGAAIRASSGKIYTGANVENCVYRATHAERAALDNALTHGERSIDAIAIVGDAPRPLYPCGQCLQDLAELDHDKSGNLTILCANAKGDYALEWLDKLFPKRFTPADLGFNPKKY